MLVGIYERGRPVVAAGEFQENLVTPGEGNLAGQGEDGLFSADGGAPAGRALRIGYKVLAGNDETAVSILTHALLEVVVEFTADEGIQIPVCTKIFVEHKVGIQVGLLLGGEAHGVATALVHIAATQFLGLRADIVVVVVAFGNPLEPGSEGDGELYVGTHGGFLLIALGIVEGEPGATTGGIAVFVAIRSAGNTAVLALITRSPVLGVVQTAPGTVDEHFTEVGFTAAGGGVGKVHAGFHFHPVRNLVAGLGHESETVEGVVRSCTVGMLVGKGGVDAGAVVTGLQGHVGIGVPAQVVGLTEVVLLGFPFNHGIVIIQDVAAVEFRTVRHSDLLSAGTIDSCNTVLGVEIVPVPHGLGVITVQGRITFTEFILEGRAAINIVNTHSLGEGDTQALGTPTALGGNHHGAVQTAGAVKGCSGCAFQDGYGGKVIRVQVLKFVTPVTVRLAPVGITVLVGVVQDYTVHHVDGLVVAG